MRSAVVIGGGLAGLTAALDCADAGMSVTLLESSSRLGGATFSFRRGEVDADNGQHVFLRCCTAYLGLLRRLGVADQVHLQSRLDVPVRSATSGRTRRLRRTGLPAPLHISRSLLSYDFVPLRTRMRAGAAALALKRVDPADPDVDAQSFGDWLERHGQGPAEAALWDLIGLATLNVRAPHASLALAATVFQIGLLGRSDAADIGWSRIPLSQLHAEPAAAALAVAGADVRLHARAGRIEARGGHARGIGDSASGWTVAFDGPAGAETIDAEAVIIAAPPSIASSLLPEGAVDMPAGWADRLGSSPIVNVHVVLDRPVLEEPMMAALDSPVQWVFDRSTPRMRRDGRQHLVLSFSAADDVIDLTTVAIRELVMAELARLLPSASRAQATDLFVTRERHATFRAAPGVSALRPPARTAFPGLALAGAYTATDWPATMEGAVRSGHAAAHAVLGLPAPVVVEQRPLVDAASNRVASARVASATAPSPAAPSPEVAS